MRFRIRLHAQHMYNGNPGSLVFEAIETAADGSEYITPFRVTRNDLAALNSLVAQLNSGVPLPIEAGDDAPRSMATGAFPQVGTGPMRTVRYAPEAD